MEKSINSRKIYWLIAIRNILVPITVLFSFIIFAKPILDFIFGGQKILNAFVQYDYSKVSFEIITVSILFFFFHLFSYLTSFKNYDRLSFDFVLLFICIYYYFIRDNVFYLGDLSFTFGQYEFSLWKFVFNFKYQDPLVITIFIFSSLNIYNCLISLLNKNIIQSDEEQTWVNDNPKEGNSEDKFLRSNLADSIAKQIMKYEDKKNSFSIGVVGLWGSGKTTFLNQIKTAIRKDPEENNIIIDFNAWQYSDEANLTKAFLKEIEVNLHSHTFLIGNISEYINFIFKNDESSRSVLVKAFFPSRRIDKLKESLRQSIIESQKRVVIFIDDIDRLHGHEIYEILTIIKNAGNLPNTIFVLAYDKDYLIKALKETVDNPEGYLSKFFHLEISLSKILNEYISNELIIRLKNKFPYLLPVKSTNKLSSKSANEFENIERLVQNTYAKELLKSIRDINKLLNALSISWPIFNNELSFREYLSLEILRLKYGNVYSLIKYLDKRFLTNIDGKYIYGIDNEIEWDKNNFKLKTEQKLDEQLKDFISNANDRSCVISVLQDLFYDNSEETKTLRSLFKKEKEDFNKSVRNVLRFNQYFMNDISGISFNELENLRENG